MKNSIFSIISPWLLVMSPLFGQEPMSKRIHPEGLRPGDMIMFVAPASPLQTNEWSKRTTG